MLFASITPHNAPRMHLTEISRRSLHPRPRNRALYVLWIAIVIGAGLASRSKVLALPPFVAKYVGDALWALMVFLGFGFLLPRKSTAIVMGCAAVFSVAIETSQLYHAPWIDAIRRTMPGHLVLGDTFVCGDIAAYLVGIALGGAIERAIRRMRETQHGPRRVTS